MAKRNPSGLGGKWEKLSKSEHRYIYNRSTAATIEDTKASYGNKSAYRYDVDGERFESLREAKRYAEKYVVQPWLVGRGPHYRTSQNPQRKLITKAILNKLPPLYAQEKVADPIVHLKLFNAFGGGTWLITEYDPSQDLAFGYVMGLAPGGDELGYISVAELRGLRKWGAPMIERDAWFKPARLSKAIKREHGGQNPGAPIEI